VNRSVGRLVDVNLNRLWEGLKVIEDIVRFGLESKRLLSAVRSLRIKLGKEIVPLRKAVIQYRESERDLGKGDQFDRLKRKNIADVLFANFKRAEESARVLEEVLKCEQELKWARRFKAVRFRLYQLEKRALLELRAKGLDRSSDGPILLPQTKKK